VKAVGNVVGQGHRRHLGQGVVAGVEQHDFAAVDPGVVNGGAQGLARGPPGALWPKPRLRMRLAAVSARCLGVRTKRLR